jgi:hypothetical protein
VGLVIFIVFAVIAHRSVSPDAPQAASSTSEQPVQRKNHHIYWVGGVRYRLEYTQDAQRERQWVRDSGPQRCVPGQDTIGPNEYPEVCKLTADDATAADRWEDAGEPKQLVASHVLPKRRATVTPARARRQDTEFLWNGADFYRDSLYRWRKDSPGCNEESDDLTTDCTLPGVAYNDAEEFEMLDDATKKAYRRPVSAAEMRRTVRQTQINNLNWALQDLQWDMDDAQQMMHDGPTY